jgi:hypothetical protein
MPPDWRMYFWMISSAVWAARLVAANRARTANAVLRMKTAPPVMDRRHDRGGSGFQLVPTLHQNSGMARGWESKSVESQQHEAYEPRNRKAPAEEIERRQKRESLELSRSRVARELEAARTPVHRTALENALRFLDDELGKV